MVTKQYYTKAAETIIVSLCSSKRVLKLPNLEEKMLRNDILFEHGKIDCYNRQ